MGGIKMDIPEIASRFLPDGSVAHWENFGSGHINLTFLLTAQNGSQYILQKINSFVFPQPEKLMENIIAVTQHLHTVDSHIHHSLHFLPTRDSKYFAVDENGHYWRCYHYVPGFCLNAPETPEDFFQSALAFGRFQRQLAAFPAETLHEILPNFHNTPDRYRQFRQSVAMDKLGRAASAKAEIEFLLSQENTASRLQSMLESGQLPLRVTHNDTKLNNVLLDSQTRQALCVLDLDTVMPGLSLFDFGDSIRFGAATAPEDEQDTAKMGLDLNLFEIFTKGYLQSASLTEKEKQMLPYGALTMTLEVAVRFLKDYLDGDVYFRIAYPEHNLIRARAQIALARDMLCKLDKMNQIVADLSVGV